MIDCELYTESLTFIQEIIDLSPTHCDNCLKLMQKIIQYYPNHIMALEIIGNIYFKQENILQAFHYFNGCIDECNHPSELNFIENIKKIEQNSNEPSQNKAKLLMAKIHSKSNEFDLALSFIEELKQPKNTLMQPF